MEVFGRPDKTGRSSSKPMPKDKRFRRVPAPFCAIPVAVMHSDAYRTLGLQSRRVLDALLLDHASHTGLENGRLVATFDQLEKVRGISRRKIAPALRDLEKRGLIQRTAVGCGNRRTGERQPSRYRLTFLPCAMDRMLATDEWKEYTAPHRTRKTDRPVPPSNTSGDHVVASQRVA